MIPEFSHSYVLPPFLGDTPVSSAQSSPYKVSATSLVARFATSPERQKILAGVLNYRADLRALGFERGFQWLDGSFVENIEAQEGRAPNDVDLVTFAYKPAGMTDQQTSLLMLSHQDLFVPAKALERYGCDAYVIPLDKAPDKLVDRARYFFGLFSHRRSDQLWKGILQMPLDSDDDAARILLDNEFSGDDDAVTT